MIRVENIRKGWPGFRLRIDRLEIEAGEYFVVLGPSGAGKSVLLSYLAGIDRPDGGRVFFDDNDVTDLPPERRSVGWVSQSNTLFPHLTVAQNIRFGRRYLKGDGAGFERRVERLVELLELAPLLDRAPADLSGGEAQRAMLARALVIEPRVLLLDEPLRGLDPTTQDMLRDELAAIHTELGTTTFHITHDHVEARALADRIAVLRAGRLEQVGPADEVFERPASCFVARFTGAENVFRLFDSADETDTDSPTLDRSVLPPAVDSTNASHIAIRPEHVEIHTDDKGDEARECLKLKGEIETLAQHGGWYRVMIRCGTAHWVAFVQQRDVARSGLEPGCEATVEVQPDYIALI